jgi:tRNA G26 N,N-dimethylase Trm1
LGRGKHRTFPDETNSKEKALRKLVKQQEAEIKRLKAELKTLNKVLESNSIYIEERLESVNVEKLIENINFIESREKAKEKKVSTSSKKKENTCPTCGSEIKSSVLPFGKLIICTSGCGWRSVERNEQKREETQ